MSPDDIESHIERARAFLGTFEEFVAAVGLAPSSCFLVWKAARRLEVLAEENRAIADRVEKDSIKRIYDTYRLQTRTPKYFEDTWRKANSLDFEAFYEWYKTDGV